MIKWKNKEIVKIADIIWGGMLCVPKDYTITAECA